MQLKPFTVLALALALGCAGWAQAAPEPVNPHATPEARALLAYLDSISGKAIITGQHNFPNDGSRWTDLAYDLTGKYPGLFGGDFGFSGGDDKDSVLSRPAMIAEAERQYRNGAVITLTWHEVRPTDDEPVTFRDSVQGHLTDYEWQQLLTPGSPLYNRWCAQVDVVAGYLRQLRDAHVPVLFRPYHEMNGNWFWWGGRPGKDGSAALYRQLYDRFVNVHHLDNLVWVWNVNAPGGNAGAIADYYPGAQFADVETIDIYGEFKQEYYDNMAALAGAKPIALGEVGVLPSPEVLDRQPRWTYFMTWCEWIQTANTVEQADAVYYAPQALTRNDPRLAVPMAAIRRATGAHNGGAPEAVPVTPSPTAEAMALLARLLAAPGNAVLSGQENLPSFPATATAAIVAATGKQPAIYAAELDGSAESRQSVLQEALKAYTKHAVVLLNWRPARPTDGALASAHGLVTDYEWNQLLTSGSDLNQRWCAQVDEAAAVLQNLQNAGVAVLWNPYPESSSKGFWWAGRKGVDGSSALYRRLFERIVSHDGLHNLLWLWETDPPGFKPDEPGSPSDFFPGLLYTDAIELRLHEIDSRSPAMRLLAQNAVGKPVGAELTGSLPAPDAFANRSGLAWFVAAPPSDPAARNEAWRKLLGDPHVALAPAQ